MKYRLHILPLFAAAAICGAVGSGCHEGDGKVDPQTLPEDVRPVAIAIMNEDPHTLASLVSYPLERTYPLRDIRDSADMVRYAPILMDDSIRKVISHAPDTVWHQVGWRGWTIDNGEYLWIDGGKIYAVNYVSRRERQMLDSLRQAEISSLEPSMRKGWIPVTCMIDSTSGAIFRIDEREDGDSASYRLAGYRSGENLNGRPTIVLYGSLQLQGSMGNRFYIFQDSEGNKAAYSPDYDGMDTVPTLELDRHGKASFYRPTRAYWLDHVHDSTAPKSIPPKGDLRMKRLK